MSMTNFQKNRCRNISIPGSPTLTCQVPSLNQSISEFTDSNFECGTTSPGLSRTLSIASARIRCHSPTFQSLRSRTISSPRSPLYSPRLAKVFSFSQVQGKRKSSISQWFNTVTSFKSKTKGIDHPETVTEEVSASLPKSKWRPSLAFIYDDKQLLPALTTFMQKQYNEENILFLQSVQHLNHKISRLLSKPRTINYAKEKQIDFEIMNIYNQYIIHNAPKQVNLSYHCFTNIISVKDRLNEIDLSQKKSLFNLCVTQIEKLISLSVLTGFYASNDFQYIASQRPVPSPILVPTSTPATDSDTSVSISTPETPASVPDTFDGMPGFDTFKYLFSFKGYKAGCYEWRIRILKCSVYRYEIGIVSRFDKSIKMNECGICDTAAFGARVVYGFNNNSFYYASFNRDNSERCKKKDLSLLGIHQQGWKVGDVIKICLNLNKRKIKFYLNDTQVRRALSVDTNDDIKYYPIIHYCGDGEYKTM